MSSPIPLRAPALALCATILIAACGSGTTTSSPDLSVACDGTTMQICAGRCVDTATDRGHCGGCNRACADGWTCKASVCRLDCGAGLSPCEIDGRCVNLQTDPDHCGSCNVTCVAPESCLAGRCSITCGPSSDGGAPDGGAGGLTPCHRACVNILNDRNNCGGCDLPCPADNACVNGQCQQVCPIGQTNCGGRCTPVQSDPDNCGTCGNLCRNATPVCSNGQCADSCRQGLRLCAQAGRCVNVLSDSDNCGACSKPCAQGLVCSNGRCAGACDPGLVACGNGCINPDNDSGNCGRCGVPCPLNQVCVRGACQAACPLGQPGLLDCGGVCADVNSDSGHCGDCNTACGNGQLCHLGRCIPQGNCVLMNLVQCGTTCRDVARDPVNCGACGTVCGAVPNGTPSCVAGQCKAKCDPNFGDCDGGYASGCEVDLRSSLLHCGACGAACSQKNITSACLAGACTGNCIAPFADCNNNLGDGCEVNLDADPVNCGSCARVCSSNNVARACGGGQCNGQCGVGFADCNRDLASDGCEKNINADAQHCGGCGKSCSNAHVAIPTCGNGVCNGACDPGFADCDADKLFTGCETAVASDLANCGACRRACSANHVVNGSCQAGACKGQCAGNFGDCDSDLGGNGCETDLLASVSSCGACGLACSRNHIAVPTCTSGVCDGACDVGWVNCNNTKQLNGCDVDVTANAANCGGCGKACPAAANANIDCKASTCVIASCKAGTGDCNATYADGCETSTATDVLHCGRCGAPCGALAHATVKCAAGACDVAACDPGFANCDMVGANGCERDVSGDVNNCGACNNKCPARLNADATCVAGVCGFACRPGFGDCNNTAADGCEVDITSTPAHCGGCNLGCPNGQNSVATCTNRICGFQCTNPFRQCVNIGMSQDCETNTGNNVNNCGGCGSACANAANASASCTAGMCGFNCSLGFGDCNGVALDGCETNTQSTVLHCGGCGRPCATAANATASCALGACALACNAGFSNCGAPIGNGCNINLNTDIANCGSCAKVCAAPANAAAACAAGVCGMGACNGGFADCDKAAGNGCEVTTNTDTSNCGACGNVCAAPANAVAACAAGVCGLGACNGGFADCDKNAGNGCEVNTNTSLANCGVCAKVCATPANAAATCAAGVCGMGACNAGFADCDKSAVTGCEVNTNTDSGNCGGCGTVCAMGKTCKNGSCQ